MNNIIFLFETFNPNKRTTFFKHKNYTNYLAYSEYAIKNKNTEHGLFGKIADFPDIEKMKDIEPVNSYITNLAYNKMPIFRCTISLDEIAIDEGKSIDESYSINQSTELQEEHNRSDSYIGKNDTIEITAQATGAAESSTKTR